MLVTPIKELHLRKQTEQILKRAGYEYVEDIEWLIKVNRLSYVRNLGKRGYEEILEAMKRRRHDND